MAQAPKRDTLWIARYSQHASLFRGSAVACGWGRSIRATPEHPRHDEHYEPGHDHDRDREHGAAAGSSRRQAARAERPLPARISCAGRAKTACASFDASSASRFGCATIHWRLSEGSRGSSATERGGSHLRRLRREMRARTPSPGGRCRSLVRPVRANMLPRYGPFARALSRLTLPSTPSGCPWRRWQPRYPEARRAFDPARRRDCD
jgi:hypothetical protein